MTTDSGYIGIEKSDALRSARQSATRIKRGIPSQWGAAAFVDFGNAVNNTHDLKPVYGYGLGARFKSPAGPIGVDIARGQKTGEYRLHFNLGVTF